MSIKIKWHRYPPSELRAEVGDLKIRIWPNQYGSYARTGYNWTIFRGEWSFSGKGEEWVRHGSEYTQAGAKRNIAYAVEALTKVD